MIRDHKYRSVCDDACMTGWNECLNFNINFPRCIECLEVEFNKDEQNRILKAFFEECVRDE